MQWFYPDFFKRQFLSEIIMISSPLSSSQRIELIDALRGFALFGILVVNMHLMYEPITLMMLGAKADASLLHVISESFVKFFFEGKFYVIFSMLFGFGFYIFLNKSAEDPDVVLPVFRRRLFFLLLFGLAHITLLWAGDVLFYYSLGGFLLILFRKSSDKKIFSWAAVFILIPLVMIAFMTLVFSIVPDEIGLDKTMQLEIDKSRDFADHVAHVYATGSFSEIVSIRVKEYLNLLTGSLFSFVPVILGVFLIGFLTARRGILVNYKENQNLIEKLFWWGLFVGIVTSALYAYSYQHAVLMLPTGWSLLSGSMHTIGGLALGMCYVSGIALLFIHGKAEFFRKYLVPVGRMALTNYLMQSTITAFLFHSYGLGLYGKIEVWQGIGLALAIFVLQIMFSRWWLGRFRFGPFEWLWRSLTYKKMQSFKQIEK
jgi:uncharacterized protein